MKFGRPVIYRAIALFGVVTFASSCKKSDTEAGDQAGPTAVSVRTVLVTAQPYTETVGALGTVAARAGHIAAALGTRCDVG